MGLSRSDADNRDRQGGNLTDLERGGSMPDTNRPDQTLSSTRRFEWFGLLSVVISTVGGAASAITSFAFVRASTDWRLLAAVVLAFVVLLVAFTAIATRLKRGPSQVANLKDRLERAFSNALDASPLNPRRTPPQRAGANRRV